MISCMFTGTDDWFTGEGTDVWLTSEGIDVTKGGGAFQTQKFNVMRKAILR